VAGHAQSIGVVHPFGLGYGNGRVSWVGEGGHGLLVVNDVATFAPAACEWTCEVELACQPELAGV
jgi:hypothetical protein